MSQIDTNINHYNLLELLQLVGLENKDNITEDDIVDHTTTLAEKYRRLDVTLSDFFIKVKKRLLQQLEDDNEEEEEETTADDSGENPNGFNVDNARDVMGLKADPDAGLTRNAQQLDWERNQYLDDPTAKMQYTDRKNKVQIMRDENEHYQMKQQRVGVVNAHNLPVVQGTMNPTLRTTIARTVNVDSQFRQTLFPYSNDPTSPSSSTSFTLVLSDPLVNVLSLKLYSINIPYTWYSVDEDVGNNVMYVDLKTGVDGVQTITVPSGNYTPQQLVAAIQTKIAANMYLAGNIDLSYNTLNGKATFYNYTSNMIAFTFYDAALTYSDKPAGSCKQSTKINNSLGWILGFRSNNIQGESTQNTFSLYGMVYEVPALIQATSSLNGTGTAIPGSITAEAVVDTTGTKYFLLVIDDFTHNRSNSGMVSIGTVNTTLSVPSYYNEDIPSMCPPSITGTQTSATSRMFVPSIPRRLTQAQLYSLNQIMTNRSSTTKDRELGPTTSDVFAVIPVRNKPSTMGQPYIDFGPTLNVHERKYFGPVVINKLRVTLKDDKGYIVNLHGGDWSFVLLTEELYEY